LKEERENKRTKWRRITQIGEENYNESGNRKLKKGTGKKKIRWIKRTTIKKRN
jgi:hypothetical protein